METQELPPAHHQLQRFGIDFIFFRGPCGLWACWEPPAEFCSSRDVDEEGGTSMGLAAFSFLGGCSMAAHHPGRAGGRGDALGRAGSSQPCWPTGTETSNDGPEKRTNPPRSAFPSWAPLSSACWVQARLVGAQGGRGLGLRPVRPCCWQCSDGCSPWRGHLLAPSPQGGGWRHLTLLDAFQKPFPLEKEGYLGGVCDGLAGRRQPEEKKQN